MSILLFIALALVLITALDADIAPGSAKQRRTDGRRNPRRVTPRRRSRRAHSKQSYYSGQIWLS